MSKSVPRDLEWVAPWVEVTDGLALDAELRRAVVDGHPLFGLKAVAVAVSTATTCCFGSNTRPTPWSSFT